MKRKMLKSALLLSVLWCIACFSVSANSDIDIPIDESLDIENELIPSEQLPTNGDPAENVDVGVPAETEEEQKDSIEPLREIIPFSPLVDTEASLNDVYNVLISIHNLLYIAFIVALIMWSHKIIISSFRRFIA